MSYTNVDMEPAPAHPFEGDDGTWKLPAWSKSPQQLQEEARMLNNAAISASLRMGGKTGGNPPAPPSWARDT